MIDSSHSPVGAGLVNPLGEEIHSEQAEQEAAAAASVPVPAAGTQITVTGIIIAVQCSDGFLRRVNMTDGNAKKTLNYLTRHQKGLVLSPSPLVMMRPRNTHVVKAEPEAGSLSEGGGQKAEVAKPEAQRHWLDKPISRNLFWFIVQPYNFRKWAAQNLRPVDEQAGNRGIQAAPTLWGLVRRLFRRG